MIAKKPKQLELKRVSDKQITTYFEKAVPEEKRNKEIFDLLLIDFITELGMAADAQFQADQKVLSNIIQEAAASKTTKLTRIDPPGWVSKLITGVPAYYECSHCKGVMVGDTEFMRYCYHCGARIE